MPSPVRRSTFHLFVAALLSLSLGTAGAAEPGGDGYAVMSFLGNELSIVTYQPGVGSNVDRNTSQRIPIADDHFDRVVLQTAGLIIKRMLPTADTQLLLATDPALFADADASFASSQALTTITAQLAAPVPRYLLVFAKHRGDTRVRMPDGMRGSGKLSGLGFYLDHNLRTTDTDSGETRHGIIAPYAYFTGMLIDLKTRQVVRSETVHDSTVESVRVNAESSDPWLALTPGRKIELIDTLLRRTIEDMVPHLVAPA